MKKNVVIVAICCAIFSIYIYKAYYLNESGAIDNGAIILSQSESSKAFSPEHGELPPEKVAEKSNNIMDTISQSASSADSKKNDDEKWHLICEKEFPPYNFIDASGNKTGLDTELITAVLNHLNIEFEISTAPWKRVVYSVDNNEVDFGYQFAGKPERFEKYWMVGPLRKEITLFAVNSASPIEDYSTLDGLKNYTIGHVLGYSYTPEFDKATFLKKETARDNNLLIKLLVNSRVDMIIGDLNTLSYSAKLKGEYEKIRFLPTILKEVPRYVAFPKDRKEKAELFAKGLDEIQNNGVYQTIMDRWK
ncbi:conserved hypothetical protein [Desulfamplus magnetovallimortis]|uniref:Solute-binding protein family 3/N-terminal domain-containing protein n=1 Tax=Desulfamplus magnetovallimortis TaxID=1246637 RepID=A0A1W1HIM0_9BACT|nr:transporter substrate-binding domain-containing protein [Desulfamplus magnetovallimortis]SLM32351.1 conserved hypothetical protein [Desulfamplus magnetovallimortis]